MAFDRPIKTHLSDSENKNDDDIDFEAQRPTRQLGGYNSLDVDDEAFTTPTNPPLPRRLLNSASFWCSTGATKAARFWRNEGGLTGLALPILGFAAWALYFSNNTTQNSKFNSQYEDSCANLKDCKSTEAIAQANAQAFAITNGSLYTVTNSFNSVIWFGIWLGATAFVLNHNRRIHGIQAQQHQLHEHKNDELDKKFNGLSSEIKILAQQGKDEIKALLESGKTEAQPSSKSPTIEKRHKGIRETLFAVLNATGAIGEDKKLKQGLLDNLQLTAEKKGQFIQEIATAIREHDSDDIHNATNGFTRR